jgi:hypothetical protein
MKQVDKGVSIPAQISRIREYCKFKKLNLMEKDILIEDGVISGSQISNNPIKNWKGPPLCITGSRMGTL